VPRGINGNNYCNRLSVSNLDESIQSFFAQDYIDSSLDSNFSHNDRLWLDKVETNISKQPDNHYVLDLPLRDNSSFPDNRSQVKNMFMGFKKRLDNDRILLKDYSDFINMMISNNFVERVPNNELKVDAGQSWYLSHHGVYHKQKNKLRVVFNCSLKCRGTSLNDNLLTGPDLANNMLGVLLRFRQEPIAVVADISKMFYQVRVSKQHSDYMRFFWMDDNDNVIEYRLLVHVFGATSSPSIANFALKHTISDKKCSSDVVNAISNNFYVDDFVASVSTEKQAVNLLGA
jgi:hypothetical protein